MNKKLNLLFIFTDQQTASALSAAGNQWLSTPGMDSLAADGVLFHNAYCTSPVCGPARASLVTGLMPHQTGAAINDVPIYDGIPNMGHIFRDAGYRTAWTGKWHVGEPFPERIPGFENLPAGGLYGAATDGQVADQAISFLRQDHDKPFLLSVSLTNPHDICYKIMEGPQALLVRAEDLPPLPDNHLPDPQEPAFIRKCRQRTFYGQENTYTESWDERHWRSYLYHYYRYTEMVDAQITRILAVLKERRLDENTLVIFTSDHGEGVAAHQWVVKLMLYEEEVRVPFIISLKNRIPAGRVDNDHLVSAVDVLPTMCDYAGVLAPAVAGVSLKTVIEEPSQPGRRRVMAELDTTEKNMTGRMLREGSWKYIIFSQGKHPEMLFDLARDPGEMNNLALHREHRDLVESFRRKIRKEMRATEDVFAFPLKETEK